MALNKAAAGRAYKCFKERRVTKAYLALVRPDWPPWDGSSDPQPLRQAIRARWAHRRWWVALRADRESLPSRCGDTCRRTR